MISLKKVNLELRNFALKEVSLEIESGDYFLLVGPTGSGKTVLLETIAGLNKVKSGEIRMDGLNITSVEPEERNIGMVYQDCALFPHLSVAENILFGLKVRRKASLEKELAGVAALTGVSHLLERKPGKLSGGEKQKVALARALAIKPNLLLLDEPLSALDPETRENLQEELKRIHTELKLTIIHVTHDFHEAQMLGKHLAVIGDGQIKQAGTPEDIFRRPDSEFVARFTMMRNIFPGTFEKGGEKPLIFRSGNTGLVVKGFKEGATHACIRPDDISLTTDPSPANGPNSFTGPISRIEDRGTEFLIFVNLPPEVCCQVTRRNFSEMGLEAGQYVRITLNQDFLHVFLE